jgi:hypothetical protein
LFVSGLPLDVKPRELYLLFRSFKDYEQSLLKLTGKPGRPPMVSYVLLIWGPFIWQYDVPTHNHMHCCLFVSCVTSLVWIPKFTDDVFCLIAAGRICHV